jgi:hypothetical protein
MSSQSLRMRLYEGDQHHESWEQRCDPDSPQELRRALLAAVEAHGVRERDPRDALPRFRLEYQGQTGGWRTFRAST